ncbi:ribonuclease H-like domain-containing protein, partial [Tanacetum coccineum]
MELRIHHSKFASPQNDNKLCERTNTENHNEELSLNILQDGELLLSPQQVVLGEFKDQICNGDSRTMENPHKNRDLGIVDSGCSRSMTGNKEKLDDFVKIVGGTVTFGGGDGKITGKGTIRTSKLNFENNKVLFTDKECLVLSKEFQLPKNGRVVLKVPRRHNLYCFNLSDIQPERDVTCLLAKASLDESTKWHRRMAHVNFKNMNKLAKHGLVNGLPSKIFTILSITVLPAKWKATQGFFTKASMLVSTACYVLNRVLVTKPHNKTPYELVSGKVPNISHLKPFGCLVTILNTSDHLGKFEGKADEGFIVGYAAHSKAYRVYNLSSKKIEETLNLRYLEDKPNVQGLGHEWYFDLDYLTDSLGYTRFKTNQPAGTQDTNIHAGTQDDSDSECDEQVIVVPSFPSNSFSGPKVHDASEMVESSSDYAEELARLQKQAYEANTTTEKHLSQADLAASRNRVPAGKIDSAAGVSYGPTKTSTLGFFLLFFHTISSPSDLANTMSSSSEMEGHYTTPILSTGYFLYSSYDVDFGTITQTIYIVCLLVFYHNLKPSSVAQALNDPAWVKAMQEEMQQFINQKVWQLVPLPDGKITIGTKWILKNKRDARGEFEMSALGELTFSLGFQVKQRMPDGFFISQDSLSRTCILDRVPQVFDSFKALIIQFAVSACSRHQCKKQTIMATSSTKAEYVAAANCCGQGSHIRYAITHDPIIYDSLVKQFWSTASLRASEEGPPAILATIDRTPYTITESLVRSQLQLDDDEGVEDLPIANIYLGSWDQFGSQLAIALICLTEGR